LNVSSPWWMLVKDGVALAIITKFLALCWILTRIADNIFVP